MDCKKKARERERFFLESEQVCQCVYVCVLKREVERGGGVRPGKEPELAHEEF